VAAHVVVLNGGSSSGKSRIARDLQTILPQPWLSLSVDDLVAALPPSLTETDAGTDSGSSAGIAFGRHGEVEVGGAFRQLEDAWLAGLAAMARAGARLIYDDVFLSGAASQQRVRNGLTGVPVLWVGVRCAPDIAAAREAARGDRTAGMAAKQAEPVHEGVEYDLEIDTSQADSLDCARAIAARLA
jgi:chloramphenicol 3-O phosphotransferase